MKPFKTKRLSIFLMLCATFACGGRLHKASRAGERDRGVAAWYSDKLEGRPTASGEKYDKTALTAAHRELPFNTIVRVVNLSNLKSVQVRINDRGPFGADKRIIDLSRQAATQIDMITSGIAEVEIEIVEIPR